MIKRSLILAGALAALALPAAASATDVTVVPDPAVSDVTALDGTIVWTSGADGSLMIKNDAGVARVPGAPAGLSYHSIDLGHDSHGKLVLTYMRCAKSNCAALRDDLHGHRATYTHLRLKGCTLRTPPALWGDRAAYGLSCTKGRLFDTRRSGLYVKTGSHTPKHLGGGHQRLASIDSVDLRGTRVAAITDLGAAFTQTVAGTGFRSFTAADNDGETEQSAPGLALGSGGAMWALGLSLYLNDPHQTRIFRLAAGCLAYQTLVNASPPDPPVPGEPDYPASNLAVDGKALYFAVQGTGIVRHTFAPTTNVCS